VFGKNLSANENFIFHVAVGENTNRGEKTSSSMLQLVKTCLPDRQAPTAAKK